MSSQSSPKSKKQEPKIGRTIWEDLRHGDIKHTLTRDLKELKEFYIDHERKERLKQMGVVKRWVFTAFWLLKSMFFKLTPARRILLVIAIILSSQMGNVQYEGEDVRVVSQFNFIGFFLLLVVLMLELKDKLLARDELKAGRAIQIALLPDRQPLMPGWDIWLFTRPANDVGGDLVDYLHLDENRLSLVLGDVAGKGLPAALLMSKLQATIRALAPDQPSIDVLGMKLNQIFCRDSLPQRFATLVYLELSDQTGRIRYLNAGHMPPILVRRSQVTEMGKGAPAIGLSINSVFSTKEIDLDSNDLLVIYSDGLTEALDEQRVMFGEAKLSQLLKTTSGMTAEAVGKFLLLEVTNFVGEAHWHDDLSLVLIRKIAA